MRLDDLEHEAGGDRSVESVAAALQHGHPALRREPVRRADHSERAPELGPGREAHPPIINRGVARLRVTLVWMGEPTARITRRATFAAAHVLRRPDWDDARNREVFGACVGDHGHNYVLEVTVAGPLDPDTGMIINLRRLDAVIREQFIDCVDHKHLNRDVPFLRDVIPTAENVALAAWRVLQPVLLPIELVRVRVAESENNSAEVVA